MDSSQLNIYNFPPQPPKWDKVGLFFVSFASTWTTVVLAGMVFCWWNRDLPILRIRGLPLAFGSVIFLHMYWLMAQIVYPVGGSMPIPIAYTVQYFIMGTWFPLGIALFHAANLRFLRVAELQRRFVAPDVKTKQVLSRSSHYSWVSRIRNIRYGKKVTIIISSVVAIQWILCAVMWVMCSKYHPSFGLPGTAIKGSTVPEQIIDLGRGWEWIPSVVYQFIWTWGVAPYLIVCAWNIRDTMGWRTQTIGACISGLHATPMFLIASYVPAFNGINQYYPPSQWIHLHTFFLEILTVFIPAYEVIKHHLRAKQAAQHRDRWDTESRQAVDVCFDKKDSRQSSLSSGSADFLSTLSVANIDQMLGLGALEHALAQCSKPLLEFSAYSDFSAENIAFLMRVGKWKASLTSDIAEKGSLDGGNWDEEGRISMYNAALSIYIDLVGPRDATFPLNLSWQQLSDLEHVFERPARIVQGEGSDNGSSAFVFDDALPTSRDSDRLSSRLTGCDGATALLARYTGEISHLFTERVFDDAERHVKNLVLLNTWPKFVYSLRRGSVDSGSSTGSNKARLQLF
ncbi:unnamed protein product [Periconia digitata]|uniref:Uncharacterized protein n=1 Tax=Periconia digitata TaxID=1303443 RepID=A0A9W4UW66_9PLEO|nr:unnamed protein product [Periconia digitata]